MLSVFLTTERTEAHLWKKALPIYTTANKINNFYLHLEIWTASEPTASLHSSIQIAKISDLAG